MKRALILSGAMFLCAWSGVASAAEAPKPGAVDPHIRSVFYNPDQLVVLQGEIGFQMMIQFAPEEHIENVSIGDGLAWQITPNKRANLLFLKPLDPTVLTNMTVVTDQRSYAFELDAIKGRGRRSMDRTYLVRFVYPQPPAPPPQVAKEAPPAPPERRNTHYSYTGDKALLPADVFDDGRFTYFRWPDTTPTPAVFVAGEGGESLVNYGVRQGYLVVEQVAPRFVLRDGKQTTTVINDAWREPPPGPDAPKPHTGKGGR